MTVTPRPDQTQTDPGGDAPSFANDVDGQQAPSIETSPGVLPQTPLPGRAPSRPDAAGDSAVGTRDEADGGGRPGPAPRP